MENKKENTSSYSARFTPTQRKVIEQAAKLKGMTAARFMRDAAYKAAAQVVNSEGAQKTLLLKISFLIAEALLNPKVEVTRELRFGDSDMSEVSIDRQMLSYRNCSDWGNEQLDPSFRHVKSISAINVMRVSLEDIEQFKKAMANSGNELLTCLMHAFDGDEEGVYRAVIDLASSQNLDDVDQDDEDVE